MLIVLGPEKVLNDVLTRVKYVQYMIQYASGGRETFKGKKVAVSGSGNVAQYAALKAIELGATVVSLSDSKGTLVATDEKGITPDEVAMIAKLKVERKQLSELVNTDSFKSKFKYIEGAPGHGFTWARLMWPCPLRPRTKFPVKKLKALSKLEPSSSRKAATWAARRMPLTSSRSTGKRRRERRFGMLQVGGMTWQFPRHIEADILEGKAANAGGVAVSGLEMAQNSQRISWTSEEVDKKLKGIMEACFKNGLKTAKEYVEPAEGEFPSLVAGSNIAGFRKVAAAMKDQGD